jgi:hypothetical protein
VKLISFDLDELERTTPQYQAIPQILASEPPGLSNITSDCPSSDVADGLYSCFGETTNIFHLIRNNMNEVAETLASFLYI